MYENGRHFRNNQSICLNQPDTVWFVNGGTVNVLSTRYENGAPIGLRRPLFTAERQQIIVGGSPASESGNTGLIAVTTGEATIAELPLAKAFDACKTNPMIREAIDEWAGQLGKVMEHRHNAPPAPERISGNRTVNYHRDNVISAEREKLLLISVESGEIQLMGYSFLPLSPEDGPILINSQMWIEIASDTATINFRPFENNQDRSLFADALINLSTRFNSFLYRFGKDQDRRESQRRETSKKMQEIAAEKAIDELASVLNPQQKYIRRATPLLTALSIVGQQLDIVIHPPSDSEDESRLRDPLDAVARASGVRWREIRLGKKWWTHDSGPLLGYLGDDDRKPVALVRHGNSYAIVDPDTRRPERLTAKHREQLCSDACMLYRPLPNNAHGLVELLRFTVTGRFGDALFILLMGLAATFLGMVAPRVTGALVDAAIPSADRYLLFELSALLLVAGAAAAGFLYLQAMTTVRTSMASEAVSQAALWDRLLKLRPNFLRQFSSGDLQTRVSAAGEISRNLSAASLRPLVSGSLATLNFLLLWSYSAELAIVAIWIGMAVLMVTVGASWLLGRLSIQLNDLQGTMMGLVVQLIGGVSKLRVAGAERRAFNFWVSKYTKHVRLSHQVAFLEDAIKIFNLALPVIASILLFWKATELTIDLPPGHPSRITIGDFIAFNAAFFLFLAGWTGVSNTIVGVIDVVLKGRRLQPILATATELPEEAADPGRLKGKIKFEGVSFRYINDGPVILDDLDFDVSPGEFVAFVGPSGSGKSTIMRLLLGFESPANGRILFDDQDLASLNILAVRRQIGSVLQNGRLNAGSIFDNIANNSRITHTEALEAAADAGFGDDIQKMPMQLHTVISEGGANLSGGQRQRLLIARALALRPKIMLFDEATSSLDNKTQAIVSEALDRRKVTRVVIAHRLSTIRHADRIFVLDRGHIVQVGTFEELSQRAGIFKNLMERQIA